MFKKLTLILVIFLIEMNLFGDTLSYRLDKISTTRFSLSTSFLPNEHNNTISSEYYSTFYLTNYFSSYFLKSIGFDCFVRTRQGIELGINSKIYPRTKYGLRINNFICFGYSLYINRMDILFGLKYGISTRSLHYYQSNVLIIKGNEVKYQVNNPMYIELRISRLFLNKLGLSINLYAIKDKGISDIQYFSGVTGGYHDFNFKKTFLFTEFEINYFIPFKN